MAGLDYLTSNTRISYPFRQGQDVPDDVKRLFVDAVIQADSYDVTLTSVSFNVSDCVLRFTVGGKEFKAVSTDFSGFGVVGDAHTKFVIDFGLLYSVASIDFKGYVLFEPMCVDTGCDRVTSIELYNGPDDPRNAIITGDIVLDIGYNIENEVMESQNALRINAGAGNGLGAVPCTTDCEKDPDTLGEPLPHENGNAVISADGCYDIVAKGNKLQIRGKCVACCQCQMYIDILDDLKIIASRIKDIKTKTDDTTGVYFSAVEKMSLASGKAELDIQMNVSADATIMGRSNMRASSYEEYSDFQAFKVTCTVTNVSGVPCLLATPDGWDSFGKMFPGRATSFKLYDGSTLTEPKHFCQNGLVALSSTVANGNKFPVHLGAFTIPTPDYYNDQASTQPSTTELGWINSSRVLTTTRRTTSDKIDFTSPITITSGDYASRLESSIEQAKSTLSAFAIQDLNKGVNPSYVLDYADYLTGVAGAEGLGYFMRAGESITITNVYVIPGDQISSNVVWLGAHFICAVYCPVLAYTIAYNLARPVTNYKTSSKGLEVETTWDHGEYEDAAITKTRLSRFYYVTAGYNIPTGKISIQE